MGPDSLIGYERLVRNAACLDLTETVAGFELRPITLRHYAMLTAINSPFLPPFKTPTEEETMAFLWLLAVEYFPPTHSEAAAERKKFLKRCAFFVQRLPPLWKTRRAMARHQLSANHCMELHAVVVKFCRDYVREAMIDAPPPTHSEGVTAPQFYCDTVAICASLAREYGGGLASYLDLPLKFAFQAMKELREHHSILNGKTPIMFNASDAEDDAKIEAMNRELHKTGKMHPAVQQYIRN